MYTRTYLTWLKCSERVTGRQQWKQLEHYCNGGGLDWTDGSEDVKEKNGDQTDKTSW